MGIAELSHRTTPSYSRFHLAFPVTDRATWDALAERFRTAGMKFVIEPCVRFCGEPGEQATMFFLDPFGNALEFKAFADINQLFATG